MTLGVVKQDCGVALLIVLGMLVLLSLVVLAFVESVTKDIGDSKSYESEVNTRMLANSALNLVETEIRAASTASNQAWISQPGLLRTYDNNGSAVAAYKLYSSSRMVVPGAFDPAAGGDLPATNAWLNQPNLYTDLNSPVAGGTTTSGSTNYIFPIIDGNDIKSIPVSGSQQLTYTTDGVLPTVEGFATAPSKVGINYQSGVALSATNNPVPMPVQWLYMLKDGTLIPASAVGNSKDVTFNGTILPSGTNPIVARIAFWTDDESCKVNINTASEGTFEDSPVCNTQPNVYNASVPDPAGSSDFDPNQIYEWDLAQRCADRGEYQRYPGHPASTCLSPILGDTIYKGLKLSNFATSGTGAGYHSLTGAGWAAFTEFLYQLSPRVSGSDAVTSGSDYSSKGGTCRPGGNTLTSTGTSASVGNGQPVTPDQDRLYASADEMFYNATMPAGAITRASNGVQVTGTTSSSGTSVPVLTPALLEKVRFFLTADSKAPEVNMFNMPRVCIWPITKQDAASLDQSDLTQASVTAKMTSFDKVIAFCATVSGTSTTAGSFNKVPFYMSRYDPLSGTHDWGATNQALYAYLQNLTGRAFPGFGPGTFAAKYGTDKDQILTEIFDYIRCVNLADTSEDTSSHSNSYTPVAYQSSWTPPPGGVSLQGQVVPLVVSSNGTRGIGRIATIGEMALVMVKEDNRINNAIAESGSTNTITLSSGTNKGTYVYAGNMQVPNTQNVLLTGSNLYDPNQGKVYTGSKDYSPLPGPAASTTLHGYDPRTQTRVQFVLIPYLFSPMAGFPALANNIRIKFSDISINVKEGVGATNPFGSGTQPDLYDTGRINNIVEGESKTGGPMGCKLLVEPAFSGNSGSPATSVFPNGELVVTGTSAPAISGSSSWTKQSGSMTISGSVTVMVQAPAVVGQTANNDTPTTIQQFTFVWPQTVVPIPALSIKDSAGTGVTYGLYTNTTGTTTESSNAGTAASATGTNAKSSSGRLSGWGNYDTKILAGAGPGSGIDGDVIRSIPFAGNNLQGDLRIAAATANIPSSWFAPLPMALSGSVPATSTYYDSSKPRSYGFREYGAQFNGTPWRNSTTGFLFENKSSHAHPKYKDDANNPTYDSPDSSSFHSYVPEGVSGVYNSKGNEGDWDNAIGVQVDGAYCNMPDEGTLRHFQQANNYVASSVAPYIGHPYVIEDSGLGLPTLFSPNRQICSPVMFGSLPTGVMAGHPWQTLLFRPAKSYYPGGVNHPGAAVATGGGLSPADQVIPYPPYSTPPDHLLLDLFWMPVVEPYPISEPFATAGKVNMNYQIAPFTYITRKTAMRAVMQSVKITALNPTEVDNSQGGSAMLSACYKDGGTFGDDAPNTHSAAGVAGRWAIGVGISVRRNIDLDSTLKQMDDLRFAVNKPFISASEICDIPLIPGDQSTEGLAVPYNIGAKIQGATNASQYDAILKTFWLGDPTNTKNSAAQAPQFGHRLTGDNSLERPYAMIYPRLTTKSNTFTVHVRVQTLKKSSSTPATLYKDGVDQVSGEFRGSFVIERYLDPATTGFYKNGDPSQPTTMTDPAAQLGPYKFRTISSKQFAQ